MIKTVTLIGSELKVEGLGGFNTFVQNLGSSVIYASKFPGITAGADNVAEIPARSGKLISTTNGTVYLLGTGKAEVTGLDGDSVIAAGGAAVYSAGGGSGDGGASLAEAMEYSDIGDEVTLGAAKEYAEALVQDKADKSEIPEIPASLPANGGNADTVGGFTVGCNVPADAVFTDTVVDISGKLDVEDPVATGSFSLNRKANTTVGSNSFAAGYNTTASANYSHAEGSDTTASREYSHAEGYRSTASGSASHAEGFSTTASGKESHAEGDHTTASGMYSHAEGLYTTASGYYSHTEGSDTTASKEYSHAEGYDTTASGKSSHASGFKTTSENYASFVCGKVNKELTAGGSYSSQEGDVFVVGNGLASKENLSATKTPSNAFRITYSGEIYGTQAFNSSGADYAEFIKPWFDDNPNGEDRVGYFVTIKDGKLRFAEPGDYIVGITSGNPSVVGNGDEDWLGRWQRDEFNRIIMEDVEEEIEKLDEQTGEITFEKTGKVIKNARFKANPDYDPSIKYVERKDRPEWDYVGMIGVLPLRDDGTCEAGGFAKCGSGGVATKADKWECHRTFFVVERIAEKIVAIEMR